MNYDKPGHYEMLAQLDKPELDGGDTLKIDLYFSGYGQIGGSKVFFSTVDGLFDTSSYCKTDFGKLVIPIKDTILYWGANRLSLGNSSSRFEFSIRGISADSVKLWGPPTIYIDNPADSNKADSINYLTLPEIEVQNPPVSIRLITKKGVSSGNYSAEIVYTYFNGEEWQGQTITVNFKINN
jgi:hypothetical protein